MLNWYKNLKIANKLFLGFFIVTILTVVVGVVGIMNLRDIDKADTELYEENTVGISHLGIASSSFQRLRYNYLMLMNVDADEEIALNRGNIETFKVTVLDELKSYIEVINNEDSIAKANEITSLYQEFLKYMDEAIKLYESGRIDEAEHIIIVDSRSIATDIFNLIDTLVDEDIQLASIKAKDNSNISNKAVVSNIIIIVISIAISASLGLFISKVIGTPLRKMGQVANRLAVGDTDVVVDVSSKDETGQLAEAFNGMIENIKYQVSVVSSMAEGDLTIDVLTKSEKDILGMNLKLMVEQNRSLIHSIAQASEHIASSANQVSESSIILSQGTAEQASSVEELTASLEEISAQTNMNASKASDANFKADSAKVNADLGSKKMREMLQAMDEINESSSNISKVIKVIDDIAFQTNILALNAAVEAARAGHLGKGFAVVAEEVRNLAARSASAAKETTEMIANSIKKSEDGTKIARETSQALDEIVASVNQANELVTEIAMASNDQAMSIGQINLGIEQVLGVVQSNSATSEENAAASEELASQSEILKATISKFNV